MTEPPSGNHDGVSKRPVVAAFDFDGTLSVRDCMVPFLCSLVGRLRLVGGVLRQPRPLIDALIRRDRDRFKVVVVRAAYRNRWVAEVDALGAEFAARIHESMLRADTLRRLVWHQREGHRVIVVSASLGSYLHPLGESLALDAVLCTEALQSGGRYTGDLIDDNCRGAEKARRLQQWLDGQGFSDAEIWAYGDSVGDRELLLAAHHPMNVKGVKVTEVPVVAGNVT